MTQGEAALCSRGNLQTDFRGSGGLAARPIILHTERRQTCPWPRKADLPGWQVIEHIDEQTRMRITLAGESGGRVRGKISMDPVQIGMSSL